MRVSSQNASRSAGRVPQRRRGHERVAELMSAAAQVFAEKGFEAATMTEIAARAGASIGSLYLFFPTKPLLAQGLLTRMADQLSERLGALRSGPRTAGTIADEVFGVLSAFLAENPVYADLIDLPGEDGWRRTVRARRREEIASLFAQAVPRLPDGQAERMAVIVPQLMRIPAVLTGNAAPLREAVLDELRTMLRDHLDRPGP